MNSELSRPPGFWRTVRILLSAARKRAAGRQKRQQELLQARTRKKSTDWGRLGFAMSVLFMVILNALAAVLLWTAVDSSLRIETERQGKIVVSQWFFDVVNRLAKNYEGRWSVAVRTLDSDFSREASNIASQYGGTREDIDRRLRDSVGKYGTRDLIPRDGTSLSFTAFPTTGVFPAMVGSLVLIWWAVMLIFQGEGLELDLQRRRNPLWEWLFSHPVPSGAIFLAEMLSPIAANPIYWGGPLFAGVLYGLVYGFGMGVLAIFLIGVPVTVATACLGKALEVAVMLRFPPRSRGAMVGLMSWIGYTSMMLFFIGLYAVRPVLAATAKYLEYLTVLPWPWLKLFLGGTGDGSFSFFTGVLTCWIFAGISIAGAVWFSKWGAQMGLSGNVGRAYSGPSSARDGRIRFGKDPLYRKEFLWFIRDRSAIVQTILIPLTIAGFQLFNLRGILSQAQGAWNYLCGASILFGTYFLWILGPKSLYSEGTALWIALTWPRGLENLLKAKAWLWSMISSGMVVLVLGYAAYLFPDSIWKIALVGVGWYFFSRSMAEKTVTLVSVPASSGEQPPIERGRRWAAQLGMLTFAIGVLTQQWTLAVVGVVYSYLTAAAMWENFRARLPYLYDPWSERLPPPPTLMHAMIAISIMVEGGAVLTAMLLAFTGRENIAIAQTIAYAVSTLLVSVGLSNFLGKRDVSPREIWTWPLSASAPKSQPWWRADDLRKPAIFRLLLLGAAGGLLLGLFALGYSTLLLHIPATSELIRKSQDLLQRLPGLRISYIIMAVGFAPFAEEYLFRGLLFRALDREWGGWRAIAGSAAFFAIYHPPLAWVPVALLGATNALLFKKTGQLAPAVVLHMVYNAFVLS